ncbi:MAG: hypothetical protein QRY72_01535 [Candidatus Rhabdochlamydia sp.]
MKFSSKIIFLTLALTSLAMTLLWFQAPRLLEKILSSKFKTQVEIHHIHLSYNCFSLRGFKLHNPPGYHLPLAFACEQALFKIPFTHLMKRTIVFEEIVLDQVYLGLEFNSISSTEGNWVTLLENLHDQTKAAALPSRSIVIKQMTLNDIRPEIYYQKESKMKPLKPIPQITLNGLGSQEGDLSDQLLSSTLGQTVKQIFIQENLKGAVESLLQTPTKALKGTLAPLKNFFSLNDLIEEKREDQEG